MLELKESCLSSRIVAESVNTPIDSWQVADSNNQIDLVPNRLRTV